MNNIRRVLAAGALAFLSISASGQQAKNWHCGLVKRPGTAARTTVADVAEDNYDMKYVKMNIALTNLSTAISGDVITRSVVTSGPLSDYVFEMLSPLVIDSVQIDGVTYPTDTASGICTTHLTAPMPLGTLFEAHVFYHGEPASSSSSFAKGITTQPSPSWGNSVTFTLSESYNASYWWPCKQSLTDKIDSADMWITVDDTLKAGSNGTLVAVTPVAPGKLRYEWKERYPIDYYLLSATVAKYNDYSYYMHFTGSSDSMLIQNYVYDNPGIIPAFGSVLDSIGYQVDYLSQLFGRYPFWKEKYGHCMAPISGGMEHQTMTTLGYFQSWLVAHELGHQWFGDNVTCASWADITMNEGFASYVEYLYFDHFRGHAVATQDMVDRQLNVMSQDGGTIYVDDTTSEDRIFDSRLSYDKGACAIHTLRHIFNDDNVFFTVLKGWQTARQYSTGSIRDFQHLITSMTTPVVNGINIDTFFNQWFFEQGFPIYTAKWNQVGNDVYVHLEQSTSMPSSVSLFTVPLEIRLKAVIGDTVIRIVNNAPVQDFHFTWPKTAISIALDPNQWITDSVASITKDATLSVATHTLPVVIAPNPATANWSVSGLPAQSTLVLTDITGRKLWQGTNAGTNAVVPADALPAGIYILNIYSANGAADVYKLMHN